MFFFRTPRNKYAISITQSCFLFFIFSQPKDFTDKEKKNFFFCSAVIDTPSSKGKIPLSGYP